MRRISIACLLSLLALSATVSAVSAATFKDVRIVLTDGNIRIVAREGIHGGLLASFIEVGVGGNEPTQYLLTADATSVYACINRGGNHPQAENKTPVTGPVSASATLTADKNGKVVGEIPLAPLGPGNFACPPNMESVLAEVSYTNVVLRDVTHGVSFSVPGTFSLTFVETK